MFGHNIIVLNLAECELLVSAVLMVISNHKVYIAKKTWLSVETSIKNKESE